MSQPLVLRFAFRDSRVIPEFELLADLRVGVADLAERFVQVPGRAGGGTQHLGREHEITHGGDVWLDRVDRSVEGPPNTCAEQ